MKEKNNDKFKILFVCTGNTCRSPMAEGILKKMLREMKIEHLQVGSAGIFSLNNAPASIFAIKITKLRGVDISGHRSRQLSQKMVEEADLILTMSQEHLDYVKRMDQKAGGKAYLLKVFSHPHPWSNEDQNQGVLFIKDPIGGNLEDYERSFLEIEKEVKRIFPELIKLITKR